MFWKNFYKSKTEEEIISDIKKDGFLPIKIFNQSSFRYEKHKHKETKLLAFIRGSMTVWIEGEKINCTEGDKLIIKSNTFHSAVVGDQGCEFFWAEKLI